MAQRPWPRHWLRSGVGRQVQLLSTAPPGWVRSRVAVQYDKHCMICNQIKISLLHLSDFVDKSFCGFPSDGLLLSLNSQSFLTANFKCSFKLAAESVGVYTAITVAFNHQKEQAVSRSAIGPPEPEPEETAKKLFPAACADIMTEAKTPERMKEPRREKESDWVSDWPLAVVHSFAEQKAACTLLLHHW